VVNLVVIVALFGAGRAVGTNPVLTGLVLTIAYFATVRSVQGVYFVHSNRAVSQFALTVGFSLISALSVIGALMFLPQYNAVTRVFTALAISGLLFFIGICAGNRFYLRTDTDWSLVRAVLLFGLPILPHALSQWILNFADRAMLRYYLDYSEVGLYSLGYNFGMVMLVFLSAINTSWGPTFMKIAENDSNAREVLARLALQIWQTFCLGAAFYLLWINEAIVVSTPSSYHSAISLSKWIVLGYLVYGSYLLVANGLFVARKSKIVPLATMSGAAVNVLLNILLIPTYGIMGAVVATMVSFAVMAILIHVLAERHYPLGIDLRSLLSAAILPAVAFVISVFLDEGYGWITRSLWKVGLTALMVVYAYGKIQRKSKPA